MALKQTFRVFVYGTLKRGEPNSNVMLTTEGQQRLIGEGRTNTKYPLIVGTKYNIPFVLNEPGKGYQVHGEVYEVDDVKLKALDVLEAYPSLYWRQEEKAQEKMDANAMVALDTEHGTKMASAFSNMHARTTLSPRARHSILMSDGTETTAWIYLLRKWRPDIYNVSTPMMSNYSSKGEHGREYVERYVRAKDMLDSGYNLHADIFGADPTDLLTKAASHAKAVEDARAPKSR